MTELPRLPEQPACADKQPDRQRIIDAGDLFKGSREIWIEHDGARYRLRITRRNKLILQK
jgi:hemin uptake protein HemP